MPEAAAGMMVTSSVKLVRPLGQGGMGSVWIAEHLSLRTQVVVKFISSELKADADARDRFSREAAAASQVKSPHVVQTFDHGITAEGVPYIVMELLDGHDLAAHMRDAGKLAPAFVVEIMTQLARALDRAHERGIVHRDIKPENIFLCDAGRGEIFVKLLDFGIAKGVEMQRLDGSTKTGSMMGSPFYMSPEQIMSSRGVDFRSDLWSLGVVAFEALTGAKPFDAETIGGLAVKIHSEPLPRPRELARELPLGVDKWFEKACARKPDDRFESAQEMVEALRDAVGLAATRRDDSPMPRSGSARKPPMLAGGSVTDAGVVRTSPSRGKATGRVLGIAGVVMLGAAVGYVASRSTGEPSRVDPSGSAAAPKPDIVATPQPDKANPPPAEHARPQEITPLASVSASVGASAAPPAASPPPPSLAVKPAGASRPSRPKPPPATSPPGGSASARPASTGHDIF